MKMFVKLFLALMTVLASTVAAACGETRPVTIVVTVNASGGKPLSGLGVEAAVDGREHYTETSATGTAQFTLDLERVRKLLRLQVCAVSHLSIPTPAGRARYDEVFSTHAPVAPEYIVVSEGVDSYARTIQLPPAVKVTGRIVRNDDGKVDQMLTLFNEQFGPMPISIRANKLTGAFQFPNAWKGVKSELQIAPLPGGVVMVLELSEQQTQSDVTLGDIVVDTRAQGEPVQLTLANMDGWPGYQVADGLPKVISILSEAGIALRELVVRDAGLVSARDGSPLHLPIGTYVVLPGGSPSDWPYRAVRTLRRSGGQAALAATGLPRFTVVAGANQFSIDATVLVSAARAIRDAQVP